MAGKPSQREDEDLYWRRAMDDMGVLGNYKCVIAGKGHDIIGDGEKILHIDNN